ncbi:MAG: efflux RND transporter periplasmic adaptor subunit [Thermoanaerobaculia bacterium]|nr:efflux RND transporter periplasmic adaptor subunit [Thermoanaerobaculia bacterium]
MTFPSEEYETAAAGPSRTRRILTTLGWVLLGVVVTLFLVADPFGLHPADTWIQSALGAEDAGRSATSAETAPATADAELWTCGMHPNVIQEEPGQCPICGMDLVPLGQGDGHDHGASAEGITEWTCEEHPFVTESEPGECPIDGRPLVPVETGDTEIASGGGSGVSEAGGDREILYYQHPHNPEVTSPEPTKDEMGMDYIPVYANQAPGSGATVRIDPSVVQNMNVQTEVVDRRDLAHPIRTVGYLEYDQERMVSVTTKYAGWVEKAYANYVGEPVRRGEPLLEVYSPELVQTQQELLSALDFARRMQDAPGESRRRAEGLVDAARTRLGYWDISDRQIAELEEEGEVFRTLTVTAPASGLIMKRMPGLEGMAVKPGMELFHIADISTLWLSVEVFEDQVAWISEGTPAEMKLSYFPGETFHGTVRFLEPAFDEKTRTLRVKLEVPNPEGKLRSGMFATVIFEPRAARDAIAVPSLAILRTGLRNIVLVQTGEGSFTPREVVLGHEGRHYVEVLEGIREGERVVTSAQFLLDSESKLQEAIQKMLAARRKGQPEEPAPGDSSPEEASGHGDHG